ncbi:hypothetical protein BASA50_007733 [Batrachochytrium salamandrivorans]|uniref:Uncharacterized protein n=1 Tax=Batrachochytrium salamandrivorans TaxID=1357716 RepID=A0ABQ8F918_9FUNG|nr:hypothetical protein BASA50_007733 [Batrachochytrium salamandrivorans]
MRVDIGIILSVLSFSVLAKVIPNDDFHGSLLVRRAVSPDTTDLLWKRADGDDEQGPSPMDLDIGAEAELVLVIMLKLVLVLVAMTVVPITLVVVVN